MTNKTLGNILVGSMVAFILTALLQDLLAYSTVDLLYRLEGLSWVVFGSWAGFRLRKL